MNKRKLGVYWVIFTCEYWSVCKTSNNTVTCIFYAVVWFIKMLKKKENVLMFNFSINQPKMEILGYLLMFTATENCFHKR